MNSLHLKFSIQKINEKKNYQLFLTMLQFRLISIFFFLYFNHSLSRSLSIYIFFLLFCSTLLSLSVSLCLSVHSIYFFFSLCVCCVPLFVRDFCLLYFARFADGVKIPQNTKCQKFDKYKITA